MKPQGLVFLLGVLLPQLLIAAPADKAPRVIEAIQGPRITFDDGSSLDMAPDVKVEKKGYELGPSDLRPGWAVVPTISATDVFSAGRVATKITVAAIPLVEKFPAYGGLKDMVAVARAELGFMPVVAALEGVDVQQALETMTSAVLRGTGRFVVADLASRDEVMNEQDLAHSGYTARNVGADGRMASPQYLVKIAILDFDYATKSGDGGSVFGFHVAKSKTRSKITMELRLVDVSTNLVVHSVRSSRTFGSDSVQFRANIAELAGGLVPFSGSDGLKDLERLAGAGISIAHNGFVKSPIGEIFSLVINDLAERMLKEMSPRPWQSVIVGVTSADRVVIRGGKDVGLRSGALLDVLRRSDAFTDPSTGETLGRVERSAGLLEIVDVSDRISEAKVISGLGLQRGDPCVLRGGSR
jgi:curli biogenesis system outer membrane secretion channel CsgG